MDAVSVADDSPDEETKDDIKYTTQKTAFMYATDYHGDLKKAFQLWDAVYAGVKAAKGDLIDNKQAFDQADKWLKEMR